MVGTAFSYTISASNIPTGFNIVGNLPPGLVFNFGTGAISGTPTQSGTWTLTIQAENSYGTGSQTLKITITSSQNVASSWLVELSARAQMEGTPNILIAGIATSGTSPKTLLFRGIGPGLGNFGVVGYLPNPQLTLFDSTNTPITTVDSWNPNLASVFQSVGAFPLTLGSNDAAVTEILQPGGYTAQITSANSQGGIALAEAYDLNPGDPINRLVNISLRAPVGTGANIVIGGFVVGGNSVEKLLIRGIGPGLGTFGLVGALAAPVLSVYDGSQNLVATITGWGIGAPYSVGPGLDTSTGMSVIPATSSDFSQVGAFALQSGSRDCALVMGLPPGSYTAEVAGAGGSTGVALVEIFETH